MNSKKHNGKPKLPQPPGKAEIPDSGVTASAEISPESIPMRLKEDICRWKRDIDKHKEFFMGKGINPFREAHEILLSFFNNFDMVAGMKAK